MKQFKITSDHLNTDSEDDCYLSPEDPIHELKIVQYLAGLGAEHRLQEYRTAQQQVNKGSNISSTAAEKVKLMKDNNIKPGSPEYIKLWFSKPYLTGEKPVGK